MQRLKQHFWLAWSSLGCKGLSLVVRLVPRVGCLDSSASNVCLPGVLGRNRKTPAWAELRKVFYPRPDVQFKRTWNPGETSEKREGISDCLLGKPQVRKPSSILVACTPSRRGQPKVRAWIIATGKEGGPVSAEPDAGGGASRTQAAQVSRLAADAGPAWPRLPPGQAEPNPGGLGPGTRATPPLPRHDSPYPHSPERCLRDAWGGHNKVKAPSKSLWREETRRRESLRAARRPASRRQLLRDFG